MPPKSLIEKRPGLLKWSPSESVGTTNYLVFRGGSPGKYTTNFAAGSRTEFYPPTLPGMNYFAIVAVAYGKLSKPSKEVQMIKP